MWVQSWVLLATLATGSAQLKFVNITSVSYDVCNASEITIPCIATDLGDVIKEEIYLTWKLNGKWFFVYDAYEDKYFRNDTFLNVDILEPWNLSEGVASIKMPIKEAIPGNYTCIVVGKNRDGEHIIELRYGSPFWFQAEERSLFIGAAIMAAALLLLQVGFVAFKFEMSLLKKISFGVAGLIVVIIIVVGAVLLSKEGYTLESKTGLGLVVLPTVILVPPLFFVFQSVFEKPPLFAIILVFLKAIGYLIAVAGFAASLPECPPQQTSVLLAGLGIIDIVAAIALIYMVVIAK